MQLREAFRALEGTTRPFSYEYWPVEGRLWMFGLHVIRFLIYQLQDPES